MLLIHMFHKTITMAEANWAEANFENELQPFVMEWLSFISFVFRCLTSFCYNC